MPKKPVHRVHRKAGNARKFAGVAIGRSGVFGSEQARDGIELLLDSVVDAKKYVATGLHTLLYGTTVSMHSIAYKHGFAVGRLLHYKYKKFEYLLEVLEQGGMGTVLYSPSSDVSYITSVELTAGAKACVAAPMHYYESGIIAGFLSSHTGEGVRTAETRCTWCDADSCTFVSGTGIERLVGEPSDINVMLNAAVERLKNSNSQKSSSKQQDCYTYLSIQPLLSGRLADSLSRLMLLFGRKLQENGARGSLATFVTRAGEFIGTAAELEKDTKAKKSIVVRYNSLNSNSRYVAITVPVFIGLVGKAYKIQKVESTLRNDAYSIHIDFRHV